MTHLLSVLVFSAHAYTIQDQVQLKQIANVAASPDGRFISYALRSTDLGANRGKFDLWLVASDGKDNRRLTAHPSDDTEPQWGRSMIYFLSTRSGSQQIWKIGVSGGEAEQVTDLPLDVKRFKVAPDEKTFVIAVDTFADCKDIACTDKRLSARKQKKGSGQLYDHLFMRHWDEWKDGRRSHLFVWKQGEAPRDLMAGIDMDAPTKPFGDSSEFTFTPDAQGIVYTARDYTKIEALSTDLDLWFVPLDGKEKPKKLTTTNRATDTTPAFSPDGKRIAYLAMAHPMYESDKQDLIVREWSKNAFAGSETKLTAKWDRSVQGFVWAQDGAHIYASADHVGHHAIFRIDGSSGEVAQLWKDGRAAELKSIKDGLVFSRDTLKDPADLWLRKHDGTLTRLTSVNAEALAQIQFGDFEQFTFAGAGGDTVHGYMVKPTGFDAKKKYPLAFLIHGGPQGSFGNEFHYRWNPQVYAAQGFATVMIDFHGSTGYGQAFTDAIRNDWGGKPFIDLQKGFDAVIAKYPFVDANRACALGASYGGFMINWIAGNWPDRFKCLVGHDGNIDERMAYLDTEELWFAEWEHQGTPWEHPENYTKHNPIDHIAKWKTPMLLIHGGKDFRVVESHGFAAFTAAQRLGVPSKFLYFPDENHWVLKPANTIEWHENVLSWIKQWTTK